MRGPTFASFLLAAALLLGACGGDDDPSDTGDGGALPAEVADLVCEDVRSAIDARSRYVGDDGDEEVRAELGASVQRLKGLANEVGRLPASGVEQARLLEIRSLLNGASAEVALVLMDRPTSPMRDDALDELGARCP